MQRDLLSLVSATEELLWRNNSGSGLKTENTAVEIRRADRAHPLSAKMLALTSLTSGVHSVSIVGSRN
jgi:hypothetical protein